jgi:uncharacterized protein with GYD domain
MAIYVSLYNFTDQGIRAVKKSPGRLKDGIAAAEAAGMKVHGAWYTEGPYDLVIVSEAADEKAALAFALGIGAQGNVRSTTMRGWTPEQFGEVVAGIS